MTPENAAAGRTFLALVRPFHATIASAFEDAGAQGRCDGDEEGTRERQKKCDPHTCPTHGFIVEGFSLGRETPSGRREGP